MSTHIIKEAKSRSKGRSKALTWEAALDLYELHLRARNSAEGTIKNYRLDVSYLRDHVAPLGPAEVTLDRLRRYQAGLLTGESTRTRKPMAPSTVGTTTTMLAGFFGFLVAEGKLIEDPTRRLERPRLPERTVGDVLSIGEVKKLLAAPSRTTPLGLRDVAIVEMAYSCGLRRNELLGLDLSDLNHEEREVLVHGKGSKTRVVPLTRAAYHEVVAYLERGRPALATKHPDSLSAIFLAQGGRRLGESGIKRLVSNYAKVAGIKRRITPHTLRRSYATHLLKGGVSLRHIQLLLGHASLDTTAVYLRLDASELKRTVLLKHPRERIAP